MSPVKKFAVALILAVILFCNTAFAKTDIALENATLEEISKALSAGLVSCEELTLYCLERIEEYNGEYNCFITLCDDALEQAKEKDKQLQSGNMKGALFGIPVVIKDNMDLKGYKTTNGYLYGETAKENAAVVEKLLSEGAIIIGKTNMSTGAENARASFSEIVGHTANAYNSLLSPGGSSGGSAAAVSLNFGFIGLGTDTNSSLRVPAALNGCVSLRPTYGLISTEGIEPLNSTRDTAGAITDNVYDQALILDVLTDFKYSYTENLTDTALEGARIGLVKELCYNENADMEIIKAFKNAVSEMESEGAQVVKVSMPELIEYSEIAFYGDSEYYRNTIKEMFEKVLKENDLDVLVFPTVLTSPITLGDSKYINGQSWLNNTDKIAPAIGVPEISVPIDMHSMGSGIGMEIIALENSEQLLLNIANSYMSKFNHRTSPIEDEGVPAIEELLANQEEAEIKEQTEGTVITEAAKNPYAGALYGSVAIILLLAFAALWGKKH